MDEQIKPVAWIVGNVSFGPYDFRKTEPRGWGYSEPLIKLSEHRAAIDALRAEVERLQSSYDQLYVHADSSYQARNEAEAEAKALRRRVGVLEDGLRVASTNLRHYGHHAAAKRAEWFIDAARKGE